MVVQMRMWCGAGGERREGVRDKQHDGRQTAKQRKARSAVVLCRQQPVVIRSGEVVRFDSIRWSGRVGRSAVLFRTKQKQEEGRVGEGDSVVVVAVAAW